MGSHPSVVRCLGIDPGLRSTGISAVELDVASGVYTSRGVRIVITAPQENKRQRKTSDDERRVRAIWRVAKEAFDLFQPHALCQEAYVVYGDRDVEGMKGAMRDHLDFLGSFASPRLLLADEGALLKLAQTADKARRKLAEGSEVVGTAGRGMAAKTLAVVGALSTLGWAANVPVFMDMPIDLKLRFVGRARASKDEVADAVYALVGGLREQIAAKGVPRGQQEHVTDATGHAVLGCEHFMEVLRDTGLGETT